jgi:uncharacterized membrane protein
VKTLARFPDVIKMMSAYLDWTTVLGDVEVNQPQTSPRSSKTFAKAEAAGTEDKMKAISHFLRITVLGGILFLTPIVVLVFILDKAFDFARRALKPVTAIIPDRLVSGAPTEAILAIVLIALLCFLAGLFARTRPAQRIVSELESSVLSKVPAYEYLKQAGASVMGLGEMADHPVVFAQLGGAWRIAVQTGVAGDGLVAVFVPNSPNPMSGSVFLVAADSVRPASVPLAAAIACLRRCGAGSEVFLSELAPRAPTT